MSDVLRFDLAKDPKGNPIVYGRVGDSNGLTRKVKVFDDGKPFDLTGWTTTFEGNTSKYKTKVFDSEGITVDDPTKGEFSYVFPNMAFAVEGQYERAYFSFTKNGIRRSSGDFEIIVFGNADINAAEAETVITEYNKLVAELHELQKSNIADLQEQQDTYIQSTDNTFAAIQGRITNLQNTIKGFETSADEVAETIQIRLSELAKRLDELELGVRLHDAYSWSADGTDRFTKVYPNENLVVTGNEYVGKMLDQTGKLVDNSTSNTMREKIQVSTGETLYFQKTSSETLDFWRGNWHKSDGTFLSRFANASNKFTMTVPTEAAFLWISYTNTGTNKIERSGYTFYTPSPIDDPINAYPTYKGISIVDSDNPADYSWQPEDNTIAKKATLDSHTENISNPHKVTKAQIGLGNVDNFTTATQAEAETGESNSVFMTPKRTAEQTLARFGQSFTPSTKFIAHRGNNSFYPENSIVAFEKTSRHWGAETDIQLTTDGKWYCFHDRTLDRMTNGTGNFMDKTSSEIEALRLDTGNGINTLSDVEKKIPTFEQYLNACIKARIVPVIEITPLKTDFTDAQLDSIVTVIRRRGLENKCVIICFTYEVLVKMRQRLPATVMHWLISEYTIDMFDKCRQSNLVASLDHTKATVTQSLIDQYHDVGMQFALWTVPYNDHQKYSEMGVDYITTDSASGNLRYFEPALRSGMLPNSVDLSGPTYIEETSNGEIHIRVNVTGGQNDVGVYICALESWAIPRHSLILIGYVRSTKVTGFTFVPVSVGVGGYSANDPSIADANIKSGYLCTGTNWEQRSSYAAFDIFYRI